MGFWQCGQKRPAFSRRPVACWQADILSARQHVCDVLLPAGPDMAGIECLLFSEMWGLARRHKNDSFYNYPLFYLIK
jgi:hypothetical protein